MKVLYLHQYFVEPTGSGGTRSYEFARRLVRDGHEVTMITSAAFLEPHRTSGAKVSRFDVDGIQVVALPIAYGNEFGAGRRLLAFARFALGSVWYAVRAPRPDVVFATSTPLTIVFPALAARLRHRRKIVFEVRDLWPSIPIALGYLRSRPAQVAARWLERLAYRTAHSIVALSPGMAAGVLAVRNDADVTIIPNSADLELYGTAPSAPTPATWPELGDRPVATYAGTIGPANDVEWIVEVCRHLPADDDLAVVVVGSGGRKERLIELAREAGVLPERLVVVDPIAKQDMPGVLGNTDVALCLFAEEPLLETTSPNKFFDALAAGTPVAINYGGWQAELLDEHACGVRLDRDPATAAGQLSSYVRAVRASGDVAVAARSLAETFDRETLYQRLVGVLTAATDER